MRSRSTHPVAVVSLPINYRLSGFSDEGGNDKKVPEQVGAVTINAQATVARPGKWQLAARNRQRGAIDNLLERAHSHE